MTLTQTLTPQTLSVFRSSNCLMTLLCMAFDGEMKCLNATGNYIHKKQVQPISIEQENHVRELGLLGDSSPEVLLRTCLNEWE